MMVSIIIPVYNQSEQLYLTLEAFNLQTFTGVFEVIVVDDGSSSSVEESLISFKPQYDLKIVRQVNQGRSVARNLGCEYSCGHIIIFCDADRVPGKEFIASHYYSQTKCNRALITGEIREVYISNLSAARDKILSDPDSYRKRSKTPPYPKFVGNLFCLDSGGTDSYMPWISTFSGNMSIQRELFLEIGGFSKAFINWGFEHFELGYRACQAGIKFFKNENAVNYHLAHFRNLEILKLYFEESIQIMNHLHPNDPLIDNYGKFMFGEISLQEIEPNRESSWIQKTEKPIIFRIDK